MQKERAEQLMSSLAGSVWSPQRVRPISVFLVLTTENWQ